MRLPVKGKGGYAADMLSNLGGALFGDTGKTLGGVAGGLLEAFGLGSYRVRQNSFLRPGGLQQIGKDQVPRIANRAGGRVVKITREEYVGDLFTGISSGEGGATVFTLDTFNINPANPALFPWLSTIANQFEEYAFRGLLFTLKTMASDVSTAQSLGTMFGATQYDINDPVFTSKQELLNYFYANSVKISDSVILPVECDPKENVLAHLYVASGNQIPENADPKFYNLGNFSVGTFGCPTAENPVAELYVSYDIDFFKPKLADGGELKLLNYSGVWRSTSYTNTAPLSGVVPDPGNFFPGGSVSGTNILFPPWMAQGTFLVLMAWGEGVGIGGTAPPTLTPGNCVFLPWEDAEGPTNVSAPNSAGTAITLMQACVVQLTDTNASLHFGTAVLPIGNLDLIITQLNGNLTGA